MVENTPIPKRYRWKKTRRRLKNKYRDRPAWDRMRLALELAMQRLRRRPDGGANFIKMECEFHPILDAVARGNLIRRRAIARRLARNAHINYNVT